MARIAAAALLITLALGSTACLTSETEIVRLEDAVQLCGRWFIYDDFHARTRTTYRWDQARRGYVDPKGEQLVRFGHLRGEAYLAQATPLKEPDTSYLPAGTPTIKIAGRFHQVGLVRVSPPRMHRQWPQCAPGDVASNPDSHGLAFVESSVSAPLTKAGRGSVLGYFVALLDCAEPHSSDERVIPEALTPGGPELAGSAAKPTLANHLPALAARCDAGQTDACYRLGLLLARGDEVPRDAARAAALFDKVCTAGTRRACVDLALAYERGEGVPRDAARAAAMLAEACAAGEPYACGPRTP
jgi:hypothetical protein